MESSSYEKKSKLFYPVSEKWLRVSAIVPADEWEYYENTEPLMNWIGPLKNVKWNYPMQKPSMVDMETTERRKHDIHSS